MHCEEGDLSERVSVEVVTVRNDHESISLIFRKVPDADLSRTDAATGRREIHGWILGD